MLFQLLAHTHDFGGKSRGVNRHLQRVANGLADGKTEVSVLLPRVHRQRISVQVARRRDEAMVVQQVKTGAGAPAP